MVFTSELEAYLASVLKQTRQVIFYSPLGSLVVIKDLVDLDPAGRLWRCCVFDVRKSRLLRLEDSSPNEQGDFFGTAEDVIKHLMNGDDL